MVINLISTGKPQGRKPGTKNIRLPWEPLHWLSRLKDEPVGKLLFDLEDGQLETADHVVRRLELVWRLQELLFWREMELKAQGQDAEPLTGAARATNHLEERLKPLTGPAYCEQGGRS
jgi:hypothetical protein